jgi:hypothetical protein
MIAADYWNVFEWQGVTILVDIESLACDFTSLTRESGQSPGNLFVNLLGLSLDGGTFLIDLHSM